jgi:hypothetical protein
MYYAASGVLHERTRIGPDVKETLAVSAGQIVIADWRDALPKEPNKLRPAVVVEGDALFDPVGALLYHDPFGQPVMSGTLAPPASAASTRAASIDLVKPDYRRRMVHTGRDQLAGQDTRIGVDERASNS